MSDRTPQTQKAIALPQTLKKRSHFPKPSKSDSYGALRYRTSPNLKIAIALQKPKIAIPTERFAIALPQTLKKRSHISKPQNSDRTLSTPQTAIPLP
ncbi:MAG: hypothetical protein ACKPFJ_01725 [Dolichospermum sp.]